MSSSRAIAAMLQEFQSYQPYDTLEADHQRKLIQLIQTNLDPLDADCFEPGHGTGSVWIFDPVKRQVAMVFHKKMKRWLQPGGHADFDEPNLKVAALREAKEEVGLQLNFEQAIVFDIDVHVIPAVAILNIGILMFAISACARFSPSPPKAKTSQRSGLMSVS